MGNVDETKEREDSSSSIQLPTSPARKFDNAESLSSPTLGQQDRFSPPIKLYFSRRPTSEIQSNALALETLTLLKEQDVSHGNLDSTNCTELVNKNSRDHSFPLLDSVLPISFDLLVEPSPILSDGSDVFYTPEMSQFDTEGEENPSTIKNLATSIHDNPFNDGHRFKEIPTGLLVDTEMTKNGYERETENNIIDCDNVENPFSDLAPGRLTRSEDAIDKAGLADGLAAQHEEVGPEAKIINSACICVAPLATLSPTRQANWEDLINLSTERSNFLHQQIIPVTTTDEIYVGPYDFPIVSNLTALQTKLGPNDITLHSFAHCSPSRTSPTDNEVDICVSLKTLVTVPDESVNDTMDLKEGTAESRTIFLADPPVILKDAYEPLEPLLISSGQVIAEIKATPIADELASLQHTADRPNWALAPMDRPNPSPRLERTQPKLSESQTLYTSIRPGAKSTSPSSDFPSAIGSTSQNDARSPKTHPESVVAATHSEDQQMAIDLGAVVNIEHPPPTHCSNCPLQKQYR
ncbi:hypothetical protein BDZ97DRAFT_1915377 [Flammula alnicola]|nr:hypothetical protein BDZ97DRAFT_1915377 [Flammula alnicola]